MTWYFVVAAVVWLVCEVLAFCILQPGYDDAGDYAFLAVIAPAFIGFLWFVMVPLGTLFLLGAGLRRLHEKIRNG